MLSDVPPRSVRRVSLLVLRYDYGDRPLAYFERPARRIGYLNAIMGVYRLHAGGVFTSRSYDKRFTRICCASTMSSVRTSSTGTIESLPRPNAAILRSWLWKRQSHGFFCRRDRGGSPHPESVAEDVCAPDAWRRKALGRVYAHYLFSSRRLVDRRTRAALLHQYGPP